MTGIVVDFSYAHDGVTPEKVKQIPGIEGFVAYAGCYDHGKNITKPELHALLDAGLTGCLVIEDNAGDLRRGAVVGANQGRRIVAAATQLGYDWRNCVLATGYDTDAHGGDYSHLLDAMEAFAREVPHPGYYGDSDSIDYLAARHPDWFYWQSNSRGFSPKNPTGHAHLWQQYDHPLAHTAGLGSSVDINLVRRTPLGFMGEGADMPLSDADVKKIVRAVWAHETRPTGSKEAYRMDRQIVNGAHQSYEARDLIAKVSRNVDALTGTVEAISKVLTASGSGVLSRVAALQAVAGDLGKQLTDVAAKVAAEAPAQQITVDVAAIADAVATKVKSIVWKAGQ